MSASKLAADLEKTHKLWREAYELLAKAMQVEKETWGNYAKVFTKFEEDYDREHSDS